MYSKNRLQTDTGDTQMDIRVRLSCDGRKENCSIVAYKIFGYGSKWGATMSINSRDVITLVFFQNFGKCRWLPVSR